jgi:hypothetical protein
MASCFEPVRPTALCRGVLLAARTRRAPTRTTGTATGEVVAPLEPSQPRPRVAQRHAHRRRRSARPAPAPRGARVANAVARAEVRRGADLAALNLGAARRRRSVLVRCEASVAAHGAADGENAVPDRHSPGREQAGLATATAEELNGSRGGRSPRRTSSTTGPSTGRSVDRRPRRRAGTPARIEQLRPRDPDARLRPDRGGDRVSRRTPQLASARGNLPAPLHPSRAGWP